MIHENARSELEDSTRKDLAILGRRCSSTTTGTRASTTWWKKRGSTRLEGVSGEFCEVFVCVYRHVCLRENACFSRVTWPLRLAHKGQKRWRPKAIVVVTLASGLAATAYAKESSMEGSLWHGTP